MELKRIGPGSAFKIMGILYGSIGLVLGCLFSLLALVGAGFAGAAGGTDGGGMFASALFGVGAIIILPLFYGLLGAIMAALMAALYNLVARFVGGLQMDLE